MLLIVVRIREFVDAEVGARCLRYRRECVHESVGSGPD